MELKSSFPKLYPLVNFIAVVLLLTGIYCFIRIGINMVMFPKYPTTGVLNISFTGYPPYSQREEDCTSPQIYYTQDGSKTRQPTDEEKSQEKDTLKRCVEGVIESREAAKVNDLSQAILFSFVGLGILITRKFIFN